MRLALAQINTVVGDLDGNRELILARLEEARDQGAELVLFPELAVTGYPPEDLLLRSAFVRAAAESLREIAAAARDVVALVGFPHFDADLYNACAVCAGGDVKAIYRKRFLPNYGVFDEERYFASGRDLVVLEVGETLVGLTICEDMWQPGPPATDLALAGAELLVNISASPFHVGKEVEREEMFVTRARDNSCFVAFCNAVGGATCGGARSPASARRRRFRSCTPASCGRPARTGTVLPARFASSSLSSSRCGWRSSSACAITSRRTASPTSSSASPVESTPP